MKWEIEKTAEFKKWYEEQTVHVQRRVDARLVRIQVAEHFGTVNVFDGLTELKWKSGLRVYTAKLPPELWVLLGGNKNGQSKDINEAKKILARINKARSNQKP